MSQPQPQFKFHFTPTRTQQHITPGSVHNIYYFENGYGASVIPEYTGMFSANDRRVIEGEYELAVLKCDNTPSTPDDSKSWHLTYKTPITSDVLRHLSQQDVESLLDQIASL